ncbi:hypothetical protein Cantr_03583 [Candida viswanathii]|uniref:Uncharacterized protein n=1 Tax=Candida viswanathii TaxID=5486 RepID=A0A367YLW2_9ASCO|nr:hypothetical protein Cantr_00531 [Candida viswanathii]RCK66569.1 hypothetical protein Cantr_03583 [Candida viswanathii]
MVYIIIDHHCSFTAYVIAISVYFTYAHQLPNFKIIIIENELPQLLIDIKPWCGVLALSHHKLLVLRHLSNFKNFLLSYTIPLGRVSIQPVLQKNLDRPVSEVLTTVIDPSHPVALLYHPSRLMNNMRSEMYNSGKVLFMSCNSNFHKLQIYNTYRGILVSTTANSTQGNSIIYNSNLIQVNCLNGQIPTSILWLPQLRYNQDTRHAIEQSNIVADPVNVDPIVNIDLNYALKQGDIVLSAMNNFIGNSIPLGNKL